LDVVQSISMKDQKNNTITQKQPYD